MTDLLTGLSSRHELHMEMPGLAAVAKPNRPLSLLLLKLRDFELWQTRLTPLAADHLLQTAAAIIKEHLSPGTIAARWNDATFALLLPNTPLWQAEAMGEEMREHASTCQLPAFFEYQGLQPDFYYGAAACPPVEHYRLPVAAQEQLRHNEGGIFAELMLAGPPLPDAATINAYIHLVGGYFAGGDPYLRRHTQLTASYALEIGNKLGLDEQQRNDLRIAASIADIAMAEAAGNALHKPGPLTLAEYTRIQRHPLLAEQLCRSLCLSENICTAVRHHHELADGSGYPDGLTGDEIPLHAAILGAAGTFAALLLPRPYRPAKKLFTAKAQLRSTLWPEEIIRALWDIA